MEDEMPTSGIIMLAGIKPGCEERLRATLNHLGNDVRGRRRALTDPEPTIDFPRSRTIHFARMAMFADPDRGPDRQRLLLATDYDGTWRDHLANILSLTSDPDSIWGCCEGYAGRDRFEDFIRSHTVEPQTYYIAFPGDALEYIRNLIQLLRQFGDPLNPLPRAPFADLLKRGLDTVGRLPLAGLDVLGILARHGPVNALLAARRINATLDRVWWAWLFNRLTFNSAPPPKTHYSAAPVGTACAPVAAGDEVVPDAAWAGTPGEDNVSQNQLTLVTVVRPERLRRLQAVLALIDVVARRLSPKGLLVGISTIHTVRWAVIDGGKRLLMASNYDGPWENYIDEFAELILSGLDAIWENSYGYPEDGAQDVAALKHFLRRHQVPANVFYSAYPDATVLNIADAIALERSVATTPAPAPAPRAGVLTTP
jgi:hypothetical protein